MKDYEIVSEEEARKHLLFRDNLKFMLIAKKVSKLELAKRIGLSQSMITQYTLGRTFPSNERIKQIAAALDCTVEDLFDDSDAPWRFGMSVED